MLMNKTIISALLATASCYYAATVNAADENGRYWIYGVGRQTCQSYLAARKAGGIAETSYKNWISGYLTSTNQSSEDTYNLLGNTDFQGAMVWLDNYCLKNSDNTIYMGMANLAAVMYPNRRKSK